MAPLEKTPVRHFVVHLAGEDVSLKETRIRVDTICEPQHPTDKWFVFKVNGEEVGKVHSHRLASWHVDGGPSP